MDWKVSDSFLVPTLGMFLRRVAIDYVRYGYTRYALREIPHHKDPVVVEQKLIALYEITRCRMTRLRRKRKGLANIQYIRLDRTFLLLATEGHHPVFEQVRSHDIHTTPLHFRGYSIGIQRGKPCVQVCRDEWKNVEYRFSKLCLRSKKEVDRKVNALPYYRFPGVVRQMLSLVEVINQRRKRAGLPLADFDMQRRDRWSKGN